MFEWSSNNVLQAARRIQALFSLGRADNDQVTMLPFVSMPEKKTKTERPIQTSPTKIMSMSVRKTAVGNKILPEKKNEKTPSSHSENMTRNPCYGCDVGCACVPSSLSLSVTSCRICSVRCLKKGNQGMPSSAPIRV